jgi:hypothetical protein
MNMASSPHLVPTRERANRGAAQASRDLFAILRLFSDLACRGPAADEDDGFTRVDDRAVQNPPHIGRTFPIAPVPLARRNETNDAGKSARSIYWLLTPSAREMRGVLPSGGFVCDHAIIR